MPAGCRVGDLHVCPVVLPIPHVGGAVVPTGPVTVHAEGPPAARVGDFVTCVGSGGPTDVIFEGALTVLVGGLPWAGRFDKTAHGGVLLMAASTVFVGGAAFVLPPQVKVKGPPGFQNEVIRDLALLAGTPSGRRLFERIEAAGEPITIIPEADPHNSFAAPVDAAKAAAGQPTGSTVMYNPSVAISVYDAAGSDIDEPPQLVLGHEMVHALNNSNGTHHHGVDPAPPASEPTIEREEAATIGTGSHSGDDLTENTFRDDLGLPRRDNHYGKTTPAPTGDLRPGGY